MSTKTDSMTTKNLNCGPFIKAGAPQKASEVHLDENKRRGYFILNILIPK